MSGHRVREGGEAFRPLARRTFVAMSFAFAALAVAPIAWGGSYLDRAALMLDEARREGDLAQPRTQDKELLNVVSALAEARVKAARKMEVPGAVARAHPHLMLVLENYERAAAYALEGDFKRFMEHLTAARDEEKTFRSVLRELGYSLPDLTLKR